MWLIMFCNKRSYMHQVLQIKININITHKMNIKHICILYIKAPICNIFIVLTQTTIIRY